MISVIKDFWQWLKVESAGQKRLRYRAILTCALCATTKYLTTKPHEATQKDTSSSCCFVRFRG